MTIETTKEFEAVYRGGLKYHSPNFLFFYLSNSFKKVGFVASKKVGGAIKRNLAKRRLGALFVGYKNLKMGSYILIAKAPLVEVDFAIIKKEFEFIIGRFSLNEEVY